MQNFANETLSRIVTNHYQAAKVFENYELDFCCKGKRPLQEACKEKNIPIDTILKELEQALSVPGDNYDYKNMSLTELAEYIVRVHHTYVKLNMPQIMGYLVRVAAKHGDHFPYMKQVYLLFGELMQEMEQHMQKEEQVLFPRIKLLDLQGVNKGNPEYFRSPITVMEHEHDHAGTIMQTIRELTNDYKAPDQACTTFRLSLASLKAFSEDLHKHVHLENNILFPKALELSTSIAPILN
jgi:regulator of cell morphogenesis and NO signaling